MEISVVVCTRNRAKRLTPLFDSFARLQIPSGMRWELLLIDNASQDETPLVIEREIRRQRLPLVHFEQPMIGKSRALNLALSKVRGELIVFTDDDVSPSPEWLRAYFEASKAYPSISGFAGRVLPSWENDKAPEWLNTQGKYAIPKPLICCFDLSDRDILLPARQVPGGNNAALRKNILMNMGLFREDLGPGTSFPFSEDTEYYRRLYLLGGHYMYLPKALVYHHNPTSRTTKLWVLKWIFHCNRSDVQIYEYPGMDTFFSVPRYLLGEAVRDFFHSLFQIDDIKRFYHLRSLVKSLGQIIGHIQKKQAR